jgi:NTE family protein
MPPETDAIPISLALQGGGAHGAFTWGVLDRLLEDGRCRFEGVSGTSAGAMNAVCLADGWTAGGREGARASLAAFWEAVAESSPFASGDADAESGRLPAATRMLLQWSAHLTPAQWNPFDINPLRDILAARIDFERLRTRCPLRLFIAATHANSGKLRIFGNHELSLDAVLASACLPTLHHTVTIDGEPYWDGGYSANPAVFPLVWDCAAADILLVLLSPLHFTETPVAAADIRSRLQEIAFNNTFLREMRVFAHLAEQAGRTPRAWWQPRWACGPLERRLAALRFHAVTTEAVLDQMPAESRLAANRAFFEKLRDAGRQQAQEWLTRHGASLGREPTLDLGRLFY